MANYSIIKAKYLNKVYINEQKLVHVRYQLDGLLIKIYIKVSHYTLHKALICITKTRVFILMNLKLTKHSNFYIHAAVKVQVKERRKELQCSVIAPFRTHTHTETNQGHCSTEC